MSPKTDCLIVGGGIIGLLTARRLHEAGLRVRLLESGRLGHESSWAAGGILSPLYPWRAPAPVHRMVQAAQDEHVSLAAELANETGVDPQWQRCGMLVLDVDEHEAAARWAAVTGVSIERLSSAALRSREPALSTRFEEALWLPEVAQIRPPRLLKALRASFGRRGIPCHEHTPVTRLLIDDGAVTGVESDQGVHEADTVVIAGGAWSSGLIPADYARMGVAPVRGQMILFRGEAGALRSIVLSGGRYVIPREDGRVLAGSTLEQVGFEKATTEAARDGLRAAATACVPALAEAPIENQWSGLRPGAVAGIPYVGAHPSIHGLFVNAGHFRNGITLAPAAARLLAELVVGAEPSLPPESYTFDARRRR